jgi:polyhydroxyalkanoate synthase
MYPIAPTPRDTLLSDGTASLLRFRGGDGPPVLLVPSLINRWFVLDLHRGASVAEAMIDAGIDTWCLDWGVPEDEDRHLTWGDLVARLARMVRAVRRATQARSIGLVGYCVGGTLAAIHAALEPSSVSALVNLAGPIDFARGGLLTHFVDKRWFDADALAAAGNISPHQMQSGFIALRPTGTVSKLVGYLDKAHDAEAMARATALEQWASDNIAFPAAAYAQYIRDLYQDNLLARGEHHVAGRRVDLGAIRCPLLTVTTSRDTICPPDAANALDALVGSTDTERLSISGGHVGAVVGPRAPTTLYPALCRWLNEKRSPSKAA